MDTPSKKRSYFNTHPQCKNSVITKKLRDRIFFRFLSDMQEIWEEIGKNAQILEIGFGDGHISYSCNKYGFNNYTGIEIDDTFLEKNQKEFPGYVFKKQDFQSFLAEGKKFDLILTSGVFEHLDKKEAGEMITGVYSALNDGGYWVNYMPNANSHLNACDLRYHDATHQCIYDNHSFEQMIFMNGIDFSNIQHKNTYYPVSRFVKFLFKIVHPIFLGITKFYYYGMGYTFPSVYTSELLSIMKK